jgi:hypothetical protein
MVIHVIASESALAVEKGHNEQMWDVNLDVAQLSVAQRKLLASHMTGDACVTCTPVGEGMDDDGRILLDDDGNITGESIQAALDAKTLAVPRGR